jgi:hypothetical protein
MIQPSADVSLEKRFDAATQTSIAAANAIKTARLRLKSEISSGR